MRLSPYYHPASNYGKRDPRSPLHASSLLPPSSPSFLSLEGLQYLWRSVTEVQVTPNIETPKYVVLKRLKVRSGVGREGEGGRTACASAGRHVRQWRPWACNALDSRLCVRVAGAAQGAGRYSGALL